MGDAQNIRLAELLAAISLAADLGRGFPQEKALRTCLVATRVGAELGLDNVELSNLYYAALIHPIGCVAFTHELARDFGSNELKAIPVYAAADASRPGEAIRAMREERKGDPITGRTRTALKNLTSGKKFGAYAAQADCEAGARFTQRIGLDGRVATIVFQVQERWDGKGVPAGLSGDAIELGARAIALANQVEIFLRVHGRDDMYAMLRRRTKGWLDPAAVDAFGRCADDVVDELDVGSVWDTVLGAEPPRVMKIPDRRVDDVCVALADLIDVKSPYLLGHSSGVAELAEAAAAQLGLAKKECIIVRRAGLLHDLGRVGVPNAVWDKPGALSASEWEQVRLHAYHSERILARSPVLEPFAKLAGMHHERMDGSGYHRAATAETLPMSARVLAAADVFEALTERRPHRPAFTAEDAAKEVEAMVASGSLDPEAADAVCASAGIARRRTRKARTWPAGLTDREVEVLRLLAQGLTKKEIARSLVIAPGTVHTHTVHIYEKLGVSTRSSVALFAMEHGLVRA